MSGIAIITEACIDVKDRACVDVCPVQCIYEFDVAKGVLFSEVEAGSGVTENTHQPNPSAIAIFEDSTPANRSPTSTDRVARRCRTRSSRPSPATTASQTRTSAGHTRRAAARRPS